jgi:hypothetical protein
MNTSSFVSVAVPHVASSIFNKFILFYSIACIIVDWVHVPMIVTMGASGACWRQADLL